MATRRMPRTRACVAGTQVEQRPGGPPPDGGRTATRHRSLSARGRGPRASSARRFGRTNGAEPHGPVVGENSEIDRRRDQLLGFSGLPPGSGWERGLRRAGHGVISPYHPCISPRRRWQRRACRRVTAQATVGTPEALSRTSGAGDPGRAGACLLALVAEVDGGEQPSRPFPCKGRYDHRKRGGSSSARQGSGAAGQTRRPVGRGAANLQDRWIHG